MSISAGYGCLLSIFRKNLVLQLLVRDEDEVRDDEDGMDPKDEDDEVQLNGGRQETNTDGEGGGPSKLRLA